MRGCRPRSRIPRPSSSPSARMRPSEALRCFGNTIDYVSGGKPERTVPRHAKETAYRALMDDVGQRHVDCVLVWKYDRFARSLSVLVSALEHFHSLGVDFI